MEKSEILTHARATTGLSQAEVAQLAGLNIRSIWRVEKGQKVSPGTLEEIARAFGCDSWDLLRQAVAQKALKKAPKMKKSRQIERENMAALELVLEKIEASQEASMRIKDASAREAVDLLLASVEILREVVRSALYPKAESSGPSIIKPKHSSIIVSRGNGNHNQITHPPISPDARKRLRDSMDTPHDPDGPF